MSTTTITPDTMVYSQVQVEGSALWVDEGGCEQPWPLSDVIRHGKTTDAVAADILSSHREGERAAGAMVVAARLVTEDEVVIAEQRIAGSR